MFSGEGYSNTAETLPKTVENNLKITETVQHPELSRIAWRAPVFWKPDIELWFFQVESSFKTAGITSEHTKFHAVVSVLDAEVLSYVRDLVIIPPPEEPYTTLKKRICLQFTQSETSRLRTLLQDMYLGDKRPSQLLHEMKSLSGKQASCDFLRTLWLQRLPVSMQQILTISSGSLEELALIADKIGEVSECRSEAAVSQISDSNREVANAGNSSELGMLKAQIQALQTSVDRLARSQGREFHDRPRRSSRSASNGNAQEQPCCFYHYRFRDRARKCIQPCRYYAQFQSRSEN